MNKANKASQSILPHACAGPKLPPWPLSCLLALQHLLVQVSFLCIFHFLFITTLPYKELNGTPRWDELLACNLFACGISTALQCSLGTRLPLVQASSFEFLIPAMILTQHMAPIHQSKGNSTEAPDICAGSNCENSRNWDQFCHEVSGAVLISALVQMALGVSGACGWVAHRCGPMVLAPSLSVIGLSAYRPAALLCSENWGVALLFVLLAILLSQHLASCRLPICQWNQARRFSLKLSGPALHLFSILLPFSGIWLVCGILRSVPNAWDMLHPSTRHLTLTNSTLQSPWLKVPYPGEQGWPVLSTRATAIGAAMGVTASVNSVGCYLLCSKALRDPPPLQHSCNRGLCTEGLGTLLSALLGSVSGTASSMPNACASSLTQATSFRTVWISALACVLLGLSPRLMGILTTIPLGIHGGVLCVTYSVAVGTGVSYFQYTNIDSGRNIFIVGFTMFMGLLVPKWLLTAPGSLATGCVPADLFFLSLLMVPAFITGFLSFFLENTVSGTLQERGLLNLSSSSKPEAGENNLQQSRKNSAQRDKLPLILRKHLLPSWCKGFPFCFLCPLGDDKDKIVNIYPLEELHRSERETTDLLLKPETVKLESELELETVQEPGITQTNLENHKCGKPIADMMAPLC
ncbi:solute carrier family 23 member 3 isoform X2 [Rhineura floridana]|uniref:solute carrier family 23 member 3 isoform X2 n=1 Tax=Rhineura floridana TaxID=261503 RepID=UPI002AC8048E|nr:solute carrier family 23 member 3 isoform X2 [Rhineura floridana]